MQPIATKMAAGLALLLGAGATAKFCPLADLAPDRVQQVSQITPVHDQLIGACSTYATADALSHFTLNSKGEPIPLAIDHLLALEVMAQGKSLFGYLNQKPGAALGSKDYDALFAPEATRGLTHPKLRLIAEWGAIPAANWKPRIPVEKFVAEGGLKKLFAPGGKYHARFLELFARAKKAREARDSNLRGKIEAEFESLMREAIEGELGVSFTAKFKVEGRSYDPANFQKTFLGIEDFNIDDYSVQEVKSYRSPGEPEVKFGDFSKDSHSRPTSYAEVEKAVRDAIDRGEPVLFAAPVDSRQTERNGAVFDSPATEPPHERAGFGEPHAMHVVGYVKDKDGNLVYWKVKNSWGTQLAPGSEGYVYFTPNYVKATPVTFEIFHRKRAPTPPPPKTGWWPTWPTWPSFRGR